MAVEYYKDVSVKVNIDSRVQWKDKIFIHISRINVRNTDWIMNVVEDFEIIVIVC